MSDTEHPVPAPPPGEELHLPGPTILPFACAIALTLIVVGTTINIIISIVGLIAFVIIVIRWVSDVRRDVDELPESHH